MDADAISRVTRALKTLLDDALRPPTGDETVFVGPLDDPSSSGFKILLFLYRVSLNADLRSTPHVVPGPDPDSPPIVYTDSLPLELRYLLTAGNSQSGGELPDLSLLGRAMQAMNSAPYLTGATVQNEIVRLSIDPVASEEMSRIWTLFPTANYRTSVIYLATPVWIDPERPDAAAIPVVQEPHLVGQKEVERR
jgi:hypothetical protein